MRKLKFFFILFFCSDLNEKNNKKKHMIKFQIISLEGKKYLQKYHFSKRSSNVAILSTQNKTRKLASNRTTKNHKKAEKKGFCG